MKKKFNVVFLSTLTLEVDEKVLKQVDDDFRENHYKFKTDEETVQHLAYNVLFNNASLSQLDGFADLPDDLMEVVNKDIDNEGCWQVK